MNEAFRRYAFGRAFRIDLSERHVDALAALCRTDVIASYGLGGSMHGLIRRGLVEQYVDAHQHTRYRPTRAGVLVYDLLVEAGEHAALEDKRRAVLEHEHQREREAWERRFGDIQITVKERFLKTPSEQEPR